MRLQLPIFPSGTKLISSCVGVYEQDSLVQYFVIGLPVYAHGKDYLQAFRFPFSNLISRGLCTKVEVKKAFCITDDYVNRAFGLFKTEGESGFFKPENRHGYCYKLVGDNLVKAQQLLDDGHVSIYNGNLANLPAKYVSFQKLCLSATTGFWLNDQL